MCAVTFNFNPFSRNMCVNFNPFLPLPQDMLLKIKDQCGTLQEIATLCKEIRKETKDDQQVQRHAKAYETLGNLSQQFSTVCATTRQQYSKLSSLLQASSEARNSPSGGLKFLPRSLSQTPTLGHRVAKTPPPTTPPRPSSVQTHRRAFSGTHYQPVFVRPTTFSLDDREKEESVGGLAAATVHKGLNSKTQQVRSFDSDKEEDLESSHMPRAPISSKQTKTDERGPKETKLRDTKTNKTAETRPKETKARDTKPTKKAQKGQKDATKDESDPIPEILSLDRSPVIAGRRVFKVPSQESLEGIWDNDTPNTGHPSEKRGSPELPVFNNRSPDRRIEQPKSHTAHDQTSSGRVRVLPPPISPHHENKVKSPPPIVKPKPNVPKKPNFLKQEGTASERREQGTSVTKATGSQPSEPEEEKAKPKKTSRFSKLYGFGGGAGGSPKKTKKEAPSNRKEKETEDRQRSPPIVGGAKEVGVADWEVPGDGRKSPILQGRRG